MARFMSPMLADGWQHGHRVLDRATIEQMWEPHNLDVPLDLDLVNGPGWFLESASIPGGSTVGRHGGTTLVFGSGPRRRLQSGRPATRNALSNRSSCPESL